MTNPERLIDPGVIASAHVVSPEHAEELNDNFTPGEIDAIIKSKQRIMQKPLASDPSRTGGGLRGTATGKAFADWR